MSMNTGLLVGFIIAIIVAVFSLVACGFVLFRRRRLRQQGEKAVPFAVHSPGNRRGRGYGHGRTDTETSTGWDPLLSNTSRQHPPSSIADERASVGSSISEWINRQPSLRTMYGTEDSDRLQWRDTHPRPKLPDFVQPVVPGDQYGYSSVAEGFDHLEPSSLIDDYYASAQNSPAPSLPRLLIPESSGTRTSNQNSRSKSTKAAKTQFLPTLEAIPSASTPASTASLYSQYSVSTQLHSALDMFPLPPLPSLLTNAFGFRMPDAQSNPETEISSQPQVPEPPKRKDTQYISELLHSRAAKRPDRSDPDSSHIGLEDHAVAHIERADSIQAFHNTGGTGHRSGGSRGVGQPSETGATARPYVDPWSSAETVNTVGDKSREDHATSTQTRKPTPHKRTPSTGPPPTGPLPPPPPQTKESASSSATPAQRARSHSRSQSNETGRRIPVSIPELTLRSHSRESSRSSSRVASGRQLPTPPASATLRPSSGDSASKLGPVSSPIPRRASPVPGPRAMSQTANTLEPFSPPPSSSSSASSRSTRDIPFDVDSEGGVVLETFFARPSKDRRSPQPGLHAGRF